jgi:hypothetical protein
MGRASPTRDPTQIRAAPDKQKKSGDFSPLSTLDAPAKHLQLSKSTRVSKEKGGDHSPPETCTGHA